MRDFDDDVLQETFSRELSSVGWLGGGWRGSRGCNRASVRGRAGGCVGGSRSHVQSPEIDDGDVRRQMSTTGGVQGRPN
jgi:hypothetical protein